MNIQMTYFPSYGFSAFLMTGPMDWSNLSGLDKMVTELEAVAQPGPGRILRCRNIKQSNYIFISAFQLLTPGGRLSKLSCLRRKI